MASGRAGARGRAGCGEAAAPARGRRSGAARGGRRILRGRPRRTRDRRQRAVGARQQRQRVDVAERIGLDADAEVQAVVARRERADRRAGADGRARADRDRPQRQVGHAAGAAADAHHALPGDPARVHDAAGARRADRRARRRGEVDAAVRARRERRAARVVERARHLAWDRSQPSLGQGGGGDRRERQDRGQD